MQFIGIFILFTTSLFHQNVFAINLSRFLAEDPPDFREVSTELENVNTTQEISDLSHNVTKFPNDSFSEDFTNATFTESDQINSTLHINQSSVQSSEDESSSSGIRSSTAISGNESHSSSSSSSVKFSSTVKMSDSATSSTEAEDDELVARGKPNITETVMNATTTKIETIYEKALELINDTYTLSILLPIAAGVVFATTIFLTIAMCRCLRRGCRRRRLRRKVLPDSVKNLRPSDRARLLAETSDEEF